MKIQVLVVLSLFIFSCKPNASDPSSTKDDFAPMESYALLNQNDIADAEVQNMRGAAMGILEHRQKEVDTSAVAMIERDLYIFDGILLSSNMRTGDSIAGEWLDFKEDLTYEYGKFDKVNGSGRYFFNFNENILLMIDNNPAIKPQEFEIKKANDILILIGKQIYRDNNIQTKLSRVATKPIAQTAPSN